MFHKIKSVKPLMGFKLLVQFTEGTTKEYDINPIIKKWPAFQAFKEIPALFDAVTVDAGGYGVVWNDELDLSCDELWENGKEVSTPFDGLLSFSDATNLWGLHESTLRKAIEYGKLLPGIDARKYGKQWIVTKQAMLREYGEPKRER